MWLLTVYERPAGSCWSRHMWVIALCSTPRTLASSAGIGRLHPSHPSHPGSVLMEHGFRTSFAKRTVLTAFRCFLKNF